MTRTSMRMTGYWKPPSPRRKSNSTNHAEGRPKPQTDRKNCPTRKITDFDFKYEQSGRGKNHLVSKTRTDLRFGQYVDFVNPAINFLERTKSSIYEDDLSLAISSVYLLTILWQLISRHDFLLNSKYKMCFLLGYCLRLTGAQMHT